MTLQRVPELGDDEHGGAPFGPVITRLRDASTFGVMMIVGDWRWTMTPEEATHVGEELLRFADLAQAPGACPA